jgi:hypothetical protein
VTPSRQALRAASPTSFENVALGSTASCVDVSRSRAAPRVARHLHEHVGVGVDVYEPPGTSAEATRRDSIQVSPTAFISAARNCRTSMRRGARPT